MPAVMIVVAMLVLLPLAKSYVSGGPTWEDFVPKPARQCEQTGLYNLLFVQNFLHPDVSVGSRRMNRLRIALGVRQDSRR